MSRPTDHALKHNFFHFKSNRPRGYTTPICIPLTLTSSASINPCDSTMYLSHVLVFALSALPLTTCCKSSNTHILHSVRASDQDRPRSALPLRAPRRERRHHQCNPPPSRASLRRTALVKVPPSVAHCGALVLPHTNSPSYLTSPLSSQSPKNTTRYGSATPTQRLATSSRRPSKLALSSGRRRWAPQAKHRSTT